MLKRFEVEFKCSCRIGQVFRRGTMPTCGACGAQYLRLGGHLRYSPGCGELAVSPSEPPPPPPATPSQTPSNTPSGDTLRWAQMSSKLGFIIASMRLNQKIHILHVEQAITLARTAIELAMDVLDVKCGNNQEAAANATEVRAGAMRVLDGLKDVDHVCKEQTTGALSPIKRPGLAPDEVGKKHFAFFSLIHLIADVLQNDTESRKYIEAESDEIRTGKYRELPTVLTDTKHGLRFRNSALSRKALPGEPRRIVMDLHSWNDDATVTHAHVHYPCHPC